MRDVSYNLVDNSVQHPLLRRPSHSNRIEPPASFTTAPSLPTAHGGIHSFINTMNGRSLISDVPGNSMFGEFSDAAIQRMMVSFIFFIKF